MTDAVIGIQGNDFVVLGADAGAGFSIIVMKHDEDKIVQLDSNKILACNGENGDRVQFSEYIQKNLNLYRFSNDRPATMKAAPHHLLPCLFLYLSLSPRSRTLSLSLSTYPYPLAFYRRLLLSSSHFSVCFFLRSAF